MNDEACQHKAGDGGDKCIVILSEVFHENLGVSAVAKFADALFTNLTNTLAGEVQLVANFLETHLGFTNAETCFDDNELTVTEGL